MIILVDSNLANDSRNVNFNNGVTCFKNFLYPLERKMVFYDCCTEKLYFTCSLL